MSKTYHTIIKNNELLQDIATYYSSVKRKIFAHICRNNYLLFKSYHDNIQHNLNNNVIADIQKPYIINSITSKEVTEFSQKYQMTSRQIKSINFELKALINSQLEIRKNLLKDKKIIVKNIEKEINQLNKEITKLSKDNSVTLNDRNCSYIKKQFNAYNEYCRNIEIKKYNQSQINYDNKKVLIFYPTNYHLPNIIKKKSIDNYLEQHKIDKNHFKVVQQYAKKNIELNKLNAKKDKLEQSIKSIEQDIDKGKIRVCFGGRKLFKSQSYIDNIDYINNESMDIYSSHSQWKKDWIKARDSNFYMTGCKNETAGNQTCVASMNKDNNNQLIDFTFRVRVPDKIVKDKGLKDKYFIMKNVNFGKFNDKLVYALENKLPITYRFVKNVHIGVNKNKKFNKKSQVTSSFPSSNKDNISPKTNKWYVHFSITEEPAEVITDKSLGTIGVDLNYSHVSVTETDSKGEHIQSFDLHFNPDTYSMDNIIDYAEGKYTKIRTIKNTNNNTVEDLMIDLHQFKLAEKVNNKKQFNQHKVNNKQNLKNLSKTFSSNYVTKPSSNTMKNIMGNVCQVITELSRKTGKPIVIEKLDFSQKKRNLKIHSTNNKNKAYNDMLSSFAYNKFKEFLSAQCKVKGLELIEINPMYTSLIGQVNYAKKLGLSIHQAASYVIARRGLLYQSFEGIPEEPLYNNINKIHLIKKSSKQNILVNESKFDICLNSKVYELPYIANSKSKLYATINNQDTVKEVISDNSLSQCVEQSNYLSEWKEISTSYHALKKEVDKKKLKLKQYREIYRERQFFLYCTKKQLRLSRSYSQDNILDHKNLF